MVVIALCITFSKIFFLNGWPSLISFEVFPLLLCSVALFFILRKVTLPYVWEIVVHSFIYFITLVDLDYLAFFPKVRETSTLTLTVIIVLLHLLIIFFTLKKLLKHRNLQFLGVLVLFMAINIINGFCSWHSPNTLLTYLLFKVFNLK